MYWGFDIIDIIKESSRLETTIEHIDDLYLSIRAEFIEGFIS